MRRRFQFRWSPALRFALHLVLACGLAAQPVLGMLGQLHGLTAHAQSSHGHAGSDLGHGHPADARGDLRDADNPMHALLHYTHCCGSTVGLPSVARQAPDIRWPTSPPGDARSHPFAATYLTAPYRPPISA